MVSGWENAKRCYQEVANDSIRDYDQNHYLLNCPNGTYDLNTREFREHRPEDRITATVVVPYDPENTACPNWTDHLEKTYQRDQSVIRFVQTWLGLNLSGEITEQMVYFWGKGRNGKSTILVTFLRLMGEYGVTIPSEAFLTNNQDGGHDRARLCGKRCAVAMEIRENATYDSAKLKSACSQDPIVGERKYEEKFDFMPTHKLTIVGNNKPKITDTSDGTRERIIFVPHLWRRPENERLPPLQVEQLFEPELTGILNWVIQGWEIFCSQGHKLIIPASIQEATQDYFDEAVIQPEYIQFLRESDEVEVDKGNGKFIVGSRALHEKYIQWRMRSGRKGNPMTETLFAIKLKEAGYEKIANYKGKFFVGIRIVDETTKFRSDTAGRLSGSPMPESLARMSTFDV